MKLYVIAKKWDSEAQAQIRYVAGEFTSYTCAEIFREAYKKRFSADAAIVSEENMLNGAYVGI